MIIKKVLQISTTPLQYDGLTKVIFSIVENADSKKYDIEVLASRGGEEVFFSRLDKMGINCIKDINRAGGIVKYIKSLMALFNDRKYDVVHIHGNSATMAIEVFAAKKSGVPTIITHGHNTRTNHPMVHALLRPYLNANTTVSVACGQMAGEFLYGKKSFEVIPNCIDTDRFKYNKAAREKIREEMGVKDALLIGHIGRFSFQKNHEFIIDVFNAVLDVRKDSKLVLVGEGELFTEIREKVYKLGISDRVIFYGVTDDIPMLLSAFDVFLLPSRFEGLSITAIEAQASGLRVITSDSTTGETDITGQCNFISLNAPVSEWVDAVTSYDTGKIDRSASKNLVDKAGFGISGLSAKIDKILETR